MDIYTLKRLSDDQYQDIFDKLLFDDPDFLINIAKGHSKDVHIGKTDTELLARANFDENIYGMASSFTSEEEFIANMQDALYYKIKDIADWVRSSPHDYNNKQDYGQLAFTLDLSPEVVGGGFKKNDLAKYETNSIRIVLTRDNSGESPLGFFLDTAYPDMHKAHKSNFKFKMEDLTSIKENGFTPIEKLYFKAKEKGYGVNIKRTQNGKQLLKVVKSLPNHEKVCALYTKDDYSFRHETLQRKRNIDSATLLNIYDKGSDFLELESIKRQYINNKNENIKNVAKNNQDR